MGCADVPTIVMDENGGTIGYNPNTGNTAVIIKIPVIEQ
jgi:hypothetical protein